MPIVLNRGFLKTDKPGLSSEWRELLSHIPGYDSEASATDGQYFDEYDAGLAIDFFPEVLQFIEGERANEPFVLEPWQQAIIAALWGWKRADGTRRYREAFIYVPRKNGKTPFCAGLVLLSAFTDQEPGAQLYSAAADREQAAIIFRHASGMIVREANLAQRSRIHKSYKSIEFPAQNGIYRALSAEADTKHGLGAHLVIVDELHAHPDSDLVDVLQTSTAARLQPLVVYITTADFNRVSVCNTKYDYATGVRDGTVTDSAFLPVIYEASPDDDWTNPDVWRKVNPNFGVSIKEEYLARECAKAKRQPSYEGTFRRLHLNQRTSVETRWIRIEDWDACKVLYPRLNRRDCYGGLDLSTTTDLSAFVLAFPSCDARTLLLPTFWIPERKLNDRKDRVPYDAWVKAGLIRVTPGDVVDYDTIRRDITALAKEFNVREIRYDPWNSTQLANQLAESDGLSMIQMRQGFVSMTGPSKEFERGIVGKLIGHDGNPVLRWMISNIAIAEDAAGNIKPDKRKSTERIDGIVASVMAIAGVMADNGGSVYQSRGLVTL